MYLSEILSRFYVIPFGQSEIVNFDPDRDPACDKPIAITWTDSETRDHHRQEFVDQKVTICGLINGQFKVATVKGEVVSFIALDGADLGAKEVRSTTGEA